MKGDHGERPGESSDLKHVVRKVVFQLHKDFEPNATRGILIVVRITAVAGLHYWQHNFKVGGRSQPFWCI